MWIKIGCLVLVMLAVGSVSATRGGENPALPPLDATLQVKVAPTTLELSCQFDHPGKVDQSFSNEEYRYAVLDKNGIQVEEALNFRQPIRFISLPKAKKSITDATDARIIKEKLKSGEEYFLVVSVRNLTGLARFKAP
jgi:hypothetical protein